MRQSVIQILVQDFGCYFFFTKMTLKTNVGKIFVYFRPPVRNLKSPTGNKLIATSDLKSPLSPGKSLGHQRSKSDATGMYAFLCQLVETVL